MQKCYVICLCELERIQLSHYPFKHENLVMFIQQGIEKLNDQTTIDFTKSTNHNYHNLEALKYIMEKRNRIEC